MKLGKRLPGQRERRWTAIGSMIPNSVGGDSKLAMLVVETRRVPLVAPSAPGYFAILGDSVNYFRQLEGNLIWEGDSVYTEGASTVTPYTPGSPLGFELPYPKVYEITVTLRVDVISGSGDFTLQLVREPADGALGLNPDFVGTVLDTHTESAPEFVIATLSGTVDVSVTGPQYIGVIYFSNGTGNVVNTNSGFIEITET